MVTRVSSSTLAEPFVELFELFRSRGELLWALTKRELTDRYAAHTLGTAWIFLHPLLMVLVYVFVFAVVFRARIDAQGLQVTSDYPTYLLSGLLPWLAFQDALNKGTNSILQDKDLVKQVVFPIEALPIKSLSGPVVTLLIFVVMLGVYKLLAGQQLAAVTLLVIPLLVCQVLAMLGLAFVLSTAGAYIRDLRDVVTAISFVMIFLLPIVYLPNWVPEGLRFVLYLNPLSYMVWCYQDVFFYARIEHPVAWVIWPLIAGALFVGGHRAFMRVKSALGNFL